jgi:predicted nuclease of predicted toxin-antitoxin system
LLEAEDKTIWQAAIKRDAILVSKDEDFVILKSVSKVSPQLIWVRTGNTTRRELLAMFEKFLPTLLTELDAGELLIEINGHGG